MSIKIQSMNLEDLQRNKKIVKYTKLLVMIGYGAIEYPLSTFTYIITKVGTDIGLEDNKTLIIVMLVITRTLLIIIETYMYFLFLRLLAFFFI